MCSICCVVSSGRLVQKRILFGGINDGSIGAADGNAPPPSAAIAVCKLTIDDYLTILVNNKYLFIYFSFIQLVIVDRWLQVNEYITLLRLLAGCQAPLNTY